MPQNDASAMNFPPRNEDNLLIERTTAAVKAFMSQPHFDSSHDFAHIQRVLATAEHILKVEGRSNPASSYDETTVRLVALLHDVDDRKYAAPLASATFANSNISGVLRDVGCPTPLAANVQAIIECVSYSRERSDPRLVQDALRNHPELAIVQDADRLDALGAVGIARAFTYGGAKDRHRGLEGTLMHFDEKLLGLEGMMKTREGKRLARLRTEHLRQFKAWWEDETKGFDSTKTSPDES